jgi:hypothetical protein
MKPRPRSVRRPGTWRTLGLLAIAVLAACGGITLALVLTVACSTGQSVAAAAPLRTTTPVMARDAGDGGSLDPGQSCTTVYATDGQQMLGGNNEDSGEPLTKVWFVPPGEGTFGLVLFGYSNYRAQGGMNDQGLFFDFLSVPKELPVLLEGKEPYPGTNYIVYDAMAKCATVACVAEMFEKYYDRETLALQHLFGDATGESAIIEPQAILRQRGGYQVATNFYQSAVTPEKGALACSRYRTVSEMLEGSPALSVETMRDVMAAVHQDGRRVWTVYTNVYDLVNRVVYVYYFSDYEHVAVIDLEEELAKGAHAYDLPALFPPNPAAQEFHASALRGRASLIRSRRVEVDPAILAAYVGEYGPTGIAPGEGVSVVPYGTSLMMLFPDSHRYELFPQSETSFFVVTWDQMDDRFRVQFDVDFGLDETTGQVLYMDFVFGPGDQYVRNDRLGPVSYVPHNPTPPPTASSQPTSTPRPTATAQPTSTPPPSATVQPTQAPLATLLVATPTVAPPAPEPGFPWGWVIPPWALLAVVVGWLAIRQRQSARR